MNLVKNLVINNVTYPLRDANTYQSLTLAQATTLETDGTYNGDEVANGTIFTESDGKFIKFGVSSGVENDFIEPLSSTGFYAGRNAPILFKGVFAYVGQQPSSPYAFINEYSTDGKDNWQQEVFSTHWGVNAAQTDDVVARFTSNDTYGTIVDVCTSTDNIHFTSKPNVSFTDTGSTYPIVLTFANKFYMFAGDGSKYKYSSDFETWSEELDCPTISTFVSVTANKDAIYFFGDNKVFSTTDGDTWDSGNASDYPNNYGLIAVGHKIFARTTNSFKVSDDGTTFTTCNLSFNNMYDAGTTASFYYVGGYYIAGYTWNFATTESQYKASLDGIDFDISETINCGMFGTYGWGNCCVGNNFLWGYDSQNYAKIKAGNSYSLTQLSYNKDEVDELITGGITLDDIAEAGTGITFTPESGIDNINANDKIGSPTISDKGLFTPTNSSYIRLSSASIGTNPAYPVVNDGYNWEITVKVKTPSNYSSGIASRLWTFAPAYNTLEGMNANLNDDGTLTFYFWKSGNWYDITSTDALDTNTWYFVRVSHNSSTGLKLESSKDGETWKPEGTSAITGGFTGQGDSQYFFLTDLFDTSHVAIEYDLTGLSFKSSYNDTDWVAYVDSGDKITISATVMSGATGSAAGTAGMVPAPSATDNTKFLRGDGTWATAGGGGGSLNSAVVTIDTSDWSSTTFECTKSVSGITSSSVVIVSPDPTSSSEYLNCGIICTGQGTNELTFRCSILPTNIVTINVAYSN